MEAALSFGPWRMRPVAWSGLGLVIEGLERDDGATAPADYVNAVLLTEAHRDAFFDLIDRHGLVVCRNVGGDDARPAEVRGRSGRGPPSPGEDTPPEPGALASQGGENRCC